MQCIDSNMLHLWVECDQLCVSRRPTAMQFAFELENTSYASSRLCMAHIALDTKHMACAAI